MTIAVKLDDLLHDRRMTLTELADRVGMTLANLSILKTGKARAIRFSTLDAICEALSCQPGDILQFESEQAERERPATARSPMISRSASGEGESLKAAMIHCSFGMTTSRARIATPMSQLTTMRIRSRTYAIGSAADGEGALT